MGKSEPADSKSPKKEEKQPAKPVGKDIRSFFSKPPGGASKPAAPAAKAEAGGGAVASAAVKEPAATAVKAEPKAAAAPAAAKPAASASPPAAKPAAKKSRVIIDEDDDDDLVVVEKKKASTPKKQAGAAAAGTDSKKQPPGSGGKGSGGKKAASGKAPAAKKRRVVADDGDDDDVVEVSSEGTDGDEEYQGGDESSDDDSDVVMEEEDDDDDSDVVMEDSEDEEAGGKAGKAKAKATPKAAAAKPAAAAAKQPAKGKGKKVAGPAMTITPKGSEPEKKKPLAGTKHARSPAKDEQGSGGKATGGPKKAPARAASPTAAARRKSAATKAVFSTNPGSASAIAAVDAAVAQLPPETEVDFSLLPEGQDGAAYASAPPPNQGNKEAPRGHPDCLTGKTFVISGVLDSLGREEATDYIKRHGGRVTGAVSGKTSFLVVGHHTGRSKYRKAREHGTKVIDEDGLFSLIRASEPFIPAENAAAPPASAPAAAAPASQPASQPPSQQPASQPAAAQRPGAGAAAGPSSARPAGVTRQPAAAGDAGQYQLWVDKYKPRNSAELVGNNTLVDNLKSWLMNWEQVHLRGGAAPTAKGGGSKPKDLSKKAALLSGPPGIGKTSAAHIMAREAGFEVVEMNASDTRNKAGKTSEGIAGKQSNIIKEMVTSTTLPPGLFGGGCGGGLGSTAPRRQLLIMDEVDGMSGGDRGGVQDLIDTIKRSKIPIICICNDKYNQKLKSLRNHCLELEFRKPTVLQISKRMSEIAAKEGLAINQATMDALVTGAGGDLRLILGQLQMVRLRSVAVSFDDVRSGRLGSSKDMDRSPFECSRQLLEPSSGQLSLGDRLELVFADSDLVPLLLQENYVNHKPAITTDAASRLRALAKAADAFSAGDVLNTSIRRHQNWGLMPAMAVVGCVLPCAYMRGGREVFGLFPGEMNFPRFSAWFGNNSTSGKQRRLLGELSTSMTASGLVAAGRSGVRLEYASALRHLLARPLQQQQEAAVPRVVAEMHEYCIDKEQFDYILDVTSFKSKAPWAADLFKDVPPKVKAAFTRTLNSTAPAARCNAQVEEVKLGRGKGKAKGGRKAAAEEEDEEEGGEGGEGGEEEAKPAVKQESGEGGEEEEEDDDDVDARTLARRLAKGGLEVHLQDDGKAGKGKKGGTAGGGGGRGKAGAAAKPAGGRGGGRGGAKAAGKK